MSAGAPVANSTKTQDELSDSRDQAIRDSAKWIIGAFAAIGAILVAGSQLSSIGSLPVGWPTSLANARLWLAVLGAALSLSAVVVAIWGCVQVLVPSNLTMRDLADDWASPSRRTSAAVEFFKKDPRFLQGLKSPQEYFELRDDLFAKLKTAPDSDIQALTDRIAKLDSRARAVTRIGQSRILESDFNRILTKLLLAASLGALGITMFAWAANPPEATPRASLTDASLIGANLRDADLTGVNMARANLTDADLTGANLTGAILTNVIWSNTICPDGINSDDVGQSCAGHRGPVG